MRRARRRVPSAPLRITPGRGIPGPVSINLARAISFPVNLAPSHQLSIIMHADLLSPLIARLRYSSPSPGKPHARARYGFGGAAAAEALSFAHQPGDVEFSCGVMPEAVRAFARPGRSLFPFRIGGTLAREDARHRGTDEAEASGRGAAGGETPSPQVAGATLSPLLELSLAH
ncbi:hypothetical protein U9M48_032162 [Paspalum notatum var. saurae]|uniref:Uncharacterized protein n=1 Tax=Paspalum notatum var. saurae TaxID=547442 RepID=A0AAQ3U447_PASNO